MNLLQKILNKFSGLYYPQDYLCLGKETFQQSLNVYLSATNRVIKDITHSHLLCGYSPLIFSIKISKDEMVLAPTIELIFTQRSLQSNEIFTEKDVLARLYLKKIISKEIAEVKIHFYECIKGVHYFVSPFNQKISALSNELFNKKPGNVFLQGNLYTQVQIAYAVPRNISLVTAGNGKLYNLFPTDLHGPLNEIHYLISLRQNGKACEQVEIVHRILVAEMNCDAYKSVYGLGKNHMQSMKAKDHFSFSDNYSSVFGLPVPVSAILYRELELIESFDHGIHRLFLFKIISKHQIEQNIPTLAHIHNVYATWRHNNGLPGNYLLR